jgi:hypothetical protein
MTAETLEIRKKIDKRIAILSPKQLNGLLTLNRYFFSSAPTAMPLAKKMLPSESFTIA